MPMPNSDDLVTRAVVSTPGLWSAGTKLALATKAVSTKEALLLSAGLSLCAFLLILPLNRLTLELAVFALFLAASYPFTKRFFAMPQAYLGIAFSFGIPMAFAAQTGELPLIVWLLMAANLLWVIAYDTEYGIGLMQKLGLAYYVGLIAASGLIIYQYRLIRKRDPVLCFRAFLHNNWVGAVVFAGIVLGYLTEAT